MKHIYTLLIGALFFSPTLLAQDDEGSDDGNLVQNGSFEEWEGKLKKPGQIELAPGWDSPTEEKADLFSENTSYEPVRVPKNVYGHQSAFDGVAYAGIRAFSYQNKEPRTYLTAKLTKQLTKGKKYCVSYYFSLSELSKYAANEVTVYISKLPVKSNKESNLKYDAQIPALSMAPQGDQLAWKGVCEQFTAKGLEKYITIGNFKENDGTNIEKKKRPKGETRMQTFDAYYFIDKVSVKEMNTGDKCSCETEDEEKSDIIFGSRITTNKTLGPDAQMERANVYYKRYQEDVDVSMKNFVGELVTLMKDNPGLKITLIGHMDAQEVDKKKMRPTLDGLGLRRADQLKKVFTDAGVADGRIVTEGKEADDPLSQSESEVGMAKNRRVEVNLR